MPAHKFILCLAIAWFAAPGTVASADKHIPACGTSNSSDPIHANRSSLQLVERAAECLSPSPIQFTRRGDKVQEGAVYTSEGKALCILRRAPGAKDDPGAFVYDPQPELEKARVDESAITGISHPSDALCGRLAAASTRLTVSNGDLLNRLQWNAAEGNCSQVLAGRTWTKKDGSVQVVDGARAPDPAHPTAAYYHGFVMANLRSGYESDRAMLQQTCNSGPGKDFYSAYFKDPSSAPHAAPSFHAIANPYTWGDKPFRESFEGLEIAPRLPFCMKDLMASVLPDANDPTGGARYWHHDIGGCKHAAVTVRILLGKVNGHNSESYCCFKKSL
jgi:hypothetical protein